jgi:hypothetical protein
LGLGAKYPNIPAAFKSYYDLQFPNGEYPFIGDGHRHYETEYFAMEKAYILAKMNGNQAQQTFFGNYLASSVAEGKYDRAVLKPRSGYPAPYYTPTQLLWFDEEIKATAEVDVDRPRPRTKRLEFAGMNIQRNISPTDSVKNSLMSFIAGGSYIHGHASGMDMELYGQGYVLGIDGGKGTYRTDIHENYYRLFAAHNSVISNGASASSGGWIDLGIEPVQSVLSEPFPGEEGVAKNYSVTRSSFNDAFNRVAPAEHQRTLALVRLSDTKGYYLDIFKAKSDYENQFHDYVYHNVGDKVEVSQEGQVLKLKEDSKRYQASKKGSWTLQQKYRHPGWHFFDNVRSSQFSDEAFQAVFTASKLAKHDISMKASIPAGFETQLTIVDAPKAYGAPKKYATDDVPTMLLRRQGDAWDAPFVVAYESITEGEDYAVQGIEYLVQDNAFKGVKVTLNVNGKERTQYIVSQDSPSDVYQNKAVDLSFKGQFALMTLNEKKEVIDMYIGSGDTLTKGKLQLNTGAEAGSAFKAF